MYIKTLCKKVRIRLNSERLNSLFFFFYLVVFNFSQQTVQLRPEACCLMINVVSRR